MLGSHHFLPPSTHYNFHLLHSPLQFSSTVYPSIFLSRWRNISHSDTRNQFNLLYMRFFFFRQIFLTIPPDYTPSKKNTFCFIWELFFFVRYFWQSFVCKKEWYAYTPSKKDSFCFIWELIKFCRRSNIFDNPTCKKEWYDYTPSKKNVSIIIPMLNFNLKPD